MFFVLFISFVSFAQERIDHQIMQRIKREGLENSKVMEYLSYLTDIYSPRLAGSDQYREAGKWIISSMNELGLQNARMEPWGTFGRGWELKKFYFAMTEPQYMPIIGTGDCGVWNWESRARRSETRPTGIESGASRSR